TSRRRPRGARTGTAARAAPAASESRSRALTTRAPIRRLGRYLVQPPDAPGRPSPRAARSSGTLVYERLSDPILVRRAKDGDPKALAALCERHAPAVERLARHFLHDPEDASDAAQEALAKLCVRIKQFRGEARFSTWLHRLVVN